MAYLSENLAELWLIVPGFDDLLLNGETTDAEGYTYTIDAIDDDCTWDSPVPIDTAVQRWMTDGAVAATQGHDNRTPAFQVRVSADTSSELAAAEKNLVKRSARVGALKWVPPEGDPEAPASVFEVWTWHLAHSFNSTDEGHLQRHYTLTFTAKPWVRSENLTVSPAPAVPGAPTTTLIDACTSTTGWTSNETLSVSGGAIRSTATAFGPDTHIFDMYRAASVTGLAALPYLRIDASTTGGTQQSLAVFINGGTALTKVASVGTVGYWALPSGTTSFTNLLVEGIVKTTSVHGSTMRLIVADISATDTIGGVGSQKMLARTLAVGGSVKTSGSLLVESPSATALGTCLVYTCADAGEGYSPPMRQYRTSGTTVTTDGTCVSGSKEPLTVTGGGSAGTIAYSIPAGQLPEGQYVVVSRILFGAAATLTATFSSGGNTVTGKATMATSGISWAVLGSIALPGKTYPAESQAAVTFQIAASATTGVHNLDELFLLDVTNGDFSLVINLGVTRLWLDAPDADPVRNRPAIYIGAQSDRSDAATPDYATIYAIGDHDLDPDGAMLFTVTDGVDNAVVTGSFYHRWHTHAGD